jgi:four helix bundle protein
MKKENIIQNKTYAFALKIIVLSRKLNHENKEFILSRQLLKSGTSIGANVEEAIGAQSRKDFYAKLTIAYKEARETSYWLRLLKDAQIAKEEDSNELLKELEEILKLIGSIQKTIKSTIENNS